MLQIPGKWLWDFWIAQDGPYYHIFYLQAPSSLKDERLRHWNVSIGHAVSEDLLNWELLPDALHPSAADSDRWDDYTTWTGSIIKHGGFWYLFYTGTSRAEKGLIQRIGFATSDDLINWRKFPGNPVIEADPEWYELLESGAWKDQAWRDPWLFCHDGVFHAYITARANHGPAMGRGVIAHATSADLTTWQVHDPATLPGEFAYLEVPQLEKIGENWCLFFCTGHDLYSQSRLARSGIRLETGTHYFVGSDPLGPFKMLDDDFLCGDETGSRYASKVIQNPEGEWIMLASHAWHPEGYQGYIGDPVPLRDTAEGRLFLEDSKP